MAKSVQNVELVSKKVWVGPKCEEANNLTFTPAVAFRALQLAIVTVILRHVIVVIIVI